MPKSKSAKTPIDSNFSSPKYWFTHFNLWLLKRIASLSSERRQKLGNFLGRLMFKLASKRRRIATKNIELCFPKLTPTETEQRVRANMMATGQGLVETASCWFSDLSEQRANTKLIGKNNLDNALEAGKGVLLLGFHMTSLEIGGCLLGHHYDLSAMYKPNKNPLFDKAMEEGRLIHLEQLLDRDNLRGTIKALRKNKIVWYATDQNYGGKTRVFVPFFGIQTATITATTKLAKMTGATVVPFTQKRLDKADHYELEFHSPFSPFPSESESNPEVKDATMINQFLEDYLVKNPVDYMWLHQRFRTRPEGEAPIY
ncbi:MAG: lipid A biosynthesis lauroyl acyltransferase [Gammaproteobacteria bacterium]|nr:MAG: lipid A biosynthesis lauroyl acyltransferase [Gammaproteobacteria bacterium]